MNLLLNVGTGRIRLGIKAVRQEVLVALDDEVIAGVPGDYSKEAIEHLFPHLLMAGLQKLSMLTRQRVSVEAFKPLILSAEQKAALLSPLTDFDMSVRSSNVLSRNKIYFMYQLCSYENEVLYMFRHFGRSSISEMERLYEKLGFTAEILKYVRRVRQEIGGTHPTPDSWEKICAHIESL